jgi:hypothetical protein
MFTIIELGGVAESAIISELEAVCKAIEQIERLDGKVELQLIVPVDRSAYAHVGGGVVGPDKGISAGCRKAVVVGVSVLIGVAKDRRVYRASAAVITPSGQSPLKWDWGRR